jgi:hypothetical protein
MSERPEHLRPRRLVDWINPTGAKKVHSLIDKVYKRKNLEMAWEKVRANRGSGGVDGQSLTDFAEQSESNWVGCSVNCWRIAIGRNRCGRSRSRRRASRESIECWAYPRSMIACVSKRCSIGWSRSSSRYSMKPTLATGEGDRHRMPCARFGERSRAAGNG